MSSKNQTNSTDNRAKTDPKKNPGSGQAQQQQSGGTGQHDKRQQGGGQREGSFDRDAKR